MSSGSKGEWLDATRSKAWRERIAADYPALFQEESLTDAYYRFREENEIPFNKNSRKTLAQVSELWQENNGLEAERTQMRSALQGVLSKVPDIPRDGDEAQENQSAEYYNCRRELVELFEERLKENREELPHRPGSRFLIMELMLDAVFACRDETFWFLMSAVLHALIHSMGQNDRGIQEYYGEEALKYLEEYTAGTIARIADGDNSRENFKNKLDALKNEILDNKNFEVKENLKKYVKMFAERIGQQLQDRKKTASKRSKLKNRLNLNALLIACFSLLLVYAVAVTVGLWKKSQNDAPPLETSETTDSVENGDTGSSDLADSVENGDTESSDLADSVENGDTGSSDSTAPVDNGDTATTPAEDENSDTSETSEQTQTYELNLKDFNDQLELIESQAEDWRKKSEDTYRYAVTDLDRNERLELIVSLSEGSSIGEHRNIIYEVVKDDSGNMTLKCCEIKNTDNNSSKEPTLASMSDYLCYQIDGVNFIITEDRLIATSIQGGAVVHEQTPQGSKTENHIYEVDGKQFVLFDNSFDDETAGTVHIEWVSIQGSDVVLKKLTDSCAGYKMVIKSKDKDTPTRP